MILKSGTRDFGAKNTERLFFLGKKDQGIFKSGLGPSIYKSRCYYGGSSSDWLLHLASTVASLHGIWVFFYDRARGTFYYPYLKSNLLFYTEHPKYKTSGNFRSGPVSGCKQYMKCLTELLSNYYLTIGEGSVGLAHYLNRDVVLPDTFSDPRGAVALEDLFLRNFSYIGFGIKSQRGYDKRITKKTDLHENVNRFLEADFAHLGIIFPAPLSSNHLSMCYQYELYQELSRDKGCKTNVSNLLEPLICHLEDMQLLNTLKNMTGKMSDSSNSMDVRMAFAQSICSRKKSIDNVQNYSSSLRDPFAIGAVHIIEKEYDLNREFL